MTFKCIIAGCRHFTDYQLLKDSCDKLLQNKTNIEILSGRCSTGVHTYTTADNIKVYGADGLAERYANERHYKLIPYPADWNRYAKSAAWVRNKQMAMDGNGLIAFWDEESKGTIMMINLAKENQLPVKVVKFKNFKQDLEEAEQQSKKPHVRKKITIPLTETSKQRYKEAHKKWYTRQYPNGVKDGFYTGPKMPVINSGSAMDTFIVNFLVWQGWSATKVTVMQKRGGKFIGTGTKPGTFDLSATINGRSIKIETKHNTDTPSDDQIKMQARERNAGAVAEFVGSIEEFFILYDKILNNQL